MNLHTRHGFTIIEMIVVIAIIGILVSIIYPALSSARKRAKKTQELSLFGQVAKAWTMYSGGHQDRLLPGYLTTDVQYYRDVAWAFPNESLIPPAPTYDNDLPNTAGPWTWRLLDYMDNHWQSMLFYREIEWDDTGTNLIEHADIVATQPAFGYNGYYVGGWWETTSHSERPTLKFSEVTLTDDRIINVVATVAAHIKSYDKQLIFCSTMSATPGTYADMPDDTPGTHFSNPSVLARVRRWVPKEGRRIKARLETNLPLGRFNGMPTICFADGHTDSVDFVDLVDQRVWISKAQDIGDIPASDFTHTQ